MSKNERTDYVKLGSLTVASVKNGVPTYLHHDQLGTAVAATTASGSIKWTKRYTPFGIALDNNNNDQAGYTGHIEDSDTGLVYMQARYYDPVIGRFYSNDPVGAVSHLSTENGIHGFNRYTYGNNNPYKYVDPDGKQSVDFSNLFSAQYGVEVPSGMIGKAITKEHVEGVPKAMADNLGGPEFFEMGVQVGNIPTPPTVAFAAASAAVLSTVYGEHGAVISAVVSKGAGNMAKNLKLGESNGTEEFAEGAASQIAGQLSGMATDAITEDIED